MRNEYDFSPEDLRKGTRGQYAARYKEGVKLVPIDPDRTKIVHDVELATETEADHLHGRVDSSLVLVRNDRFRAWKS